jgi:hypothetical protein
VATTKIYESPDGLLRFLVVQDDDGDVSLGFDEYAWHTHGTFWQRRSQARR